MVQEEEEEEELDSPTLDAGHAWKETTQDSFSKNSSLEEFFSDKLFLRRIILLRQILLLRIILLKT